MSLSAYTDAGTEAPTANARCWWCFRDVDRALHDFAKCHEWMLAPRRERAKRRRSPKYAPRAEPATLALFDQP